MATPPAPADPTALDVSQKELRLLMEIDQVRDAAKDPASMLSSLLNVIADEFSTDVALLFVIDPDSQVLELRAVNDRSGALGAAPPDSLNALAQRSLTSDTVTVTSSDELGGARGEVQVAVVPIIMGEDERLGTLLLLRSGRLFDDAEVEALTFLESQLDSALVQARRLFELDLRNKELETIYRVDRLRDEHLPFDEMLSRVLEELVREIDADVAFIMLYDESGEQLEMRAVSYGDLASSPSAAATLEKAANTAVTQAERIHWGDLEGEVGSVLGVPLILRDEVLGVFGLARRRKGGFGEADRRLMSAINGDFGRSWDVRWTRPSWSGSSPTPMSTS
jgi:GAF domain-containing protein